MKKILFILIVGLGLSLSGNAQTSFTETGNIHCGLRPVTGTQVWEDNMPSGTGGLSLS